MCVYTHTCVCVCNNNNQRKRNYQFENVGPWEELEGGYLGGLAGRKGSRDVIKFYPHKNEV